jgi:hypothetical protein
VIALCAAARHDNPYPPAVEPPTSRFRRWYDVNWPPIAGMTSYVLAVVLLTADLAQDWAVSSSALPGYAALVAAGTAGTVFGARK